jgi:hypothetical protein
LWAVREVIIGVLDRKYHIDLGAAELDQLSDMGGCQLNHYTGYGEAETCPEVVLRIEGNSTCPDRFATTKCERGPDFPTPSQFRSLKNREIAIVGNPERLPGVVCSAAGLGDDSCEDPMAASTNIANAARKPIVARVAQNFTYCFLEDI